MREQDVDVCVMGVYLGVVREFQVEQLTESRCCGERQQHGVVIKCSGSLAAEHRLCFQNLIPGPCGGCDYIRKSGKCHIPCFRRRYCGHATATWTTWISCVIPSSV